MQLLLSVYFTSIVSLYVLTGYCILRIPNVRPNSKNSTPFLINPNGNIPGVSVSSAVSNGTPTLLQAPPNITPSSNSTSSVKRSAQRNQDITEQPAKKAKGSGAPASITVLPSGRAVHPSDSNNGLSSGQSQFTFSRPIHAPLASNFLPSETQPVPADWSRTPANLTASTTSNSLRPGTTPLPADWGRMTTTSSHAPPSTSSNAHLVPADKTRTSTNITSTTSSDSPRTGTSPLPADWGRISTTSSPAPSTSFNPPWAHNRAVPGPKKTATTNGKPMANFTPTTTQNNVSSQRLQPPTGASGQMDGA